MKKIKVIVLLIFGVTVSLQAKEEKSLDITKHIEIYNRALKELELNYVDSLDYESMLSFSLDNMLYTLDPYTVFIPEQEKESIRVMRSGEYGGIGAVVSKIGDGVFIYSPYKNMPAGKNDVRAGDKILSVDGKKTKELSVSQVSDMLRGVPGTEIELKLQREGVEKTIVKKFKREIVKVDPIPYFGMLDSVTAFVVFNDFIDISYLELKKILGDLNAKYKVENLIIDLRNNGGGLIAQSVKISSLFVPKGTEIVSVKGRTQSNVVKHVTQSEPLYQNMNLAFLVSENTASAAEILSGSMQDLDRALVFGQRTFGKGLVQAIRTLPYNTYLKITTAKYYLPSGRCIQAIDYDDRKNHGRDRNIPDSLTTEFFTKKKRVVRDGSGIIPDVKIEEKQGNLNIALYLYSKNLYFLYANKYVVGRNTIPSPSEFKLTDDEFNDFVKYVKDTKFTYKLESERYLNELQDLVKYEGLDVVSDSIFVQLKAVLQPNVDRDIYLFREDVQANLEKEIVKRYYFQAGEIEYSIKTDEDLKVVMEYLKDRKKGDTLLLPLSKGTF